VRQPLNQLGAQQAIGSACIGLARLLRKSLWLTLAPLHAQAARHRDGVDKDRQVAIHRSGLAKALTHGVKVRLRVRLIIAQRWVRPGNKDGKVTALTPGAWAQGVACPTFDGKIAGF
jgi:hypothetical protein